MRIKVCGITRAEDAQRAAELGVDALGFVLWPHSPRAIALEAARAIVGGLPPFVTAVGVFVDPTTEDIARARDAGLQVAQVHGRAPAVPRGMPLLQAVHLAADGGGIVPAVPGDAAVLVDGFDPARRGGTGRTVDWSHVGRIAAGRPVVLAGGLTPGNVRTAMVRARPWAVDVSSGVERRPGVKDHDKLAAFVAAVRAEA
ncbi:MAG: phosphoribosylanthranilate isomerase [Acidobacteria bacterium]|nr:phosphoribosylanthranilate isomerase [Acidobacteriota bacterium]